MTLTAEEVQQLALCKSNLRKGLIQYPDFPAPGILFEDILPLFSNHALHGQLIDALVLSLNTFATEKIDVVVGLDARGFLFGPSLALKIGAGFVPVRKRGKMPGDCVSVAYVKEYGEDWFEMQKLGVSPGQKVLIVDDIIATGGSAAAAGTLVRQLGGDLVGYMFILELNFLKGRDKLDAPVHTLLTGQEAKALN